MAATIPEQFKDLFNPDSSVGIEVNSEEQALRGEANGLLPQSGNRTSWFDEKS